VFRQLVLQHGASVIKVDKLTYAANLAPLRKDRRPTYTKVQLHTAVRSIKFLLTTIFAGRIQRVPGDEHAPHTSIEYGLRTLVFGSTAGASAISS
jgi:hypothetical protein